jgi:hypothetical protein
LISTEYPTASCGAFVPIYYQDSNSTSKYPYCSVIVSCGNVSHHNRVQISWRRSSWPCMDPLHQNIKPCLLEKPATCSQGSRASGFGTTIRSTTNTGMVVRLIEDNQLVNWCGEIASVVVRRYTAWTSSPIQSFRIITRPDVRLSAPARISNMMCSHPSPKAGN